MIEKYVLKAIQQGQTQKVHIAVGGAGVVGNVLIIKAVDSVRYQLTNVVTLVSPQKIQIKRKDGDLHLAMPGGDIDAPDIVIEDYFNVKEATLWGSSVDGEWSAYNTSVLDVSSSALTHPKTPVAQSFVTGTAMLGGESLFANSWVWAGVIGAAAASGGGGGGGGGGVTTEPITPLSVIKSYASGGVITPSAQNYSDAGVTLPVVTGTSDILNAMNAVVASKNSVDVATVDQLNALAVKLKAAYDRILSEANGSSVDDTPGDNPTVAQFADIGVAVSTQAKTLDLLNSAIGELSIAAVDTVAELKTLANTATSVMTLAAVVTGGATPALIQTDAELIVGLNALLGGGSSVTVSNLAAIKASLIATADDGVGLNTIAKLKTIVSLQLLKDYANSIAGVSVNTPTLTIYKNAGVKVLNSLSQDDTSASADIDGIAVLGALGSEGVSMTSAAWLNTLNSALDKRTDGNVLTVAQIQAMANSYYRILSEADGVVNTAINVDAHPETSATTDNDPTATDYANIGATVGNVKSIDLLNDYVGQSVKTAVDTVNEINTIAQAAYNVVYHAGMTTAASGATPELYTLDADWIAGLTALGVSGVTASNLSGLKAAIDGTSDDGTEVDTIQKIKNLLNPSIALQILKDYADANAGAGVTAPTLGGLPLINTVPTSGTYTDLGIKTFKSLSNVLDADRKYFNDPSTLGGAESNNFLSATILNTALDRLTGATLTKAKVQAMVDSYYRILLEADNKYVGDSNGGASYYNNSDITHTEDTDVYADTTNDFINASAFYDPTLDDYANIGVTVADAISDTTYNVTTGIGNETLDLLNDAIGRMNATAVNTAGKINELAITANDVMLLAKNSSATQTDANLITGLNNLLNLNTSNGANINNITTIKAAIVAEGGGSGLTVNTAEKLLRVLALTRLKNFTDDGSVMGSKTASTPTLNDWSATGVMANAAGLTDGADVALNQATYWKTTYATNGLNALNTALDTYVGSAINLTLLQAIVDSYGRILQNADGSRATVTDVSLVSNDTTSTNSSGNNGLNYRDVIEQDFINVGVNHTGANDGTGTGLYYLKTGELLASSMGSLSNTAVDTVGELNTLMGYAENVMKLGKGVSVPYTDTQWLSALTGLGITGANSSNIAAIKTAIDGSTDNTTGDGTALDTYDKLQAIVSLVRLNDYAMLNAGYQTPIISDYQSIMSKQLGYDHYSDAKSSYLNAYNDAINGQSSIDSSGSSVSTMVTNYNLVLEMADGNRNSTPALVPNAAQYNGILGISDVTGDGAATVSYLLNSVIDGLSVSKVDSISDLAGLIATAQKIQTLTSTSNAATLTRIELTNFGLTDGNGHTLSDTNSVGAYWVSDLELANFQNTQLRGSGGFANADTWQELQNLMNTAILAV